MLPSDLLFQSLSEEANPWLYWLKHVSGKVQRFAGIINDVSGNSTGVVKFVDTHMNTRMNPTGLVFVKPTFMTRQHVGSKCWFWVSFRCSGPRAENLLLQDHVECREGHLAFTEENTLMYEKSVILHEIAAMCGHRCRSLLAPAPSNCLTQILRSGCHLWNRDQLTTKLRCNQVAMTTGRDTPRNAGDPGLQCHLRSCRELARNRLQIRSRPWH